MTKVLIACESELVRKGLESVVSSDPQLQRVGSLDNVSDLEHRIEGADVVLIAAGADSDVRNLAGSFGTAGGKRPTLVLLGPPSAGPSAREMLRSGIAALLPHDATGEEILAAVRAAAAGLVVVHPALVEAEEEGRPPRHLGATISPLTPRELEILTMLAEGLGNKEIAWRLKISEHTVKFHVTSIFTKLDASSRAEAVSLGFRLGLILV